MAAAFVVDLVNRFLRHPRRRTDGLKCPFKFRVDLTYSVEDIAISIFLTFCLKLSSHAQFWGVLITWTMFFVIETLKRHILGWIRVVWCIDRVYTSMRFCCRRRQARKTRKLCYRRDDRAVRPICGCPENFRDSLTTLTATIPNIFHGLLFWSTIWMFLQNLKSVALPVLR